MKAFIKPCKKYYSNVETDRSRVSGKITTCYKSIGFPGGGYFKCENGVVRDDIKEDRDLKAWWMPLDRFVFLTHEQYMTLKGSGIEEIEI